MRGPVHGPQALHRHRGLSRWNNVEIEALHTLSRTREEAISGTLVNLHKKFLDQTPAAVDAMEAPLDKVATLIGYMPINSFNEVAVVAAVIYGGMADRIANGDDGRGSEDAQEMLEAYHRLRTEIRLSRIGG